MLGGEGYPRAFIPLDRCIFPFYDTEWTDGKLVVKAETQEKIMRKIMVIAAHPDDEILCVGATIEKRVRNGNKAMALLLGEGQTSRWIDRNEIPENIIKSLTA